MSKTGARPHGKPQALLQVEECDSTMFELGSHDAGRAEAETIAIERHRTLQIIHT